MVDAAISDAFTVDSALARTHVHRFAVAEDDGSFAVADGNGACVVDVLAHIVPLVGGEAGHCLVECDGIVRVGDAVGLHIGDVVAQAVATEGCAYGYISKENGECAAVEVFAAVAIHGVVARRHVTAVAECQLSVPTPVVLAAIGEAEVVGHRGLDGDRGIGRGDEVSGRDAGDGRGVVFVADGITLVTTVEVAVGDGVVGGADAGGGAGDKVANECTDVFLSINVAGGADCGIDDMAVLDSGFRTFSGNGADVDGRNVSQSAAYSWAYEDDVLDGAKMNVAEESCIAVAAIDRETADGVAAAVVMALKPVAVVADGRPGTGERDGRSLHEVRVLVIVAVVHVVA